MENSLQKKIKIISQEMRDGARGQQCTINIAGVCDNNVKTTVLCHFPDISHGTSSKSTDISAGIGCHKCHQVLDGQVPYDWQPGDKDFYMRRSQTRTLTVFIALGIVTVKGFSL